MIATLARKDARVCDGTVPKLCLLAFADCAGGKTAPMTSLRRTALVAAVLAAALTLLAPAAGAAPPIRFGLKDDAWLMHGPGTVAERVTQLKVVGVQVVRFSLQWDQIARAQPADATDPDDPAYVWGEGDEVVQELHRQRLDALLDIVGSPAWANGGRGPSYIPTTGTSIASFATAAAKRYPWVRRWTIWNEPNQRRWLVPTSPSLYVTRLLNPAYTALHAAIRGVQVGGGVTAPRGGSGGVSPVAWLRGMRSAGARLDAYAHNPYPLDPKRESPSAGGCTQLQCETLTMATLPRLLTEVRRAFGAKRIWLTEYGYQTNPPDPALGVPPARQAQYESEAAMRAYLAPGVDLLIHFLYRDEPSIGRFQSGLLFLNDRPKPAYAAFELPLAERASRGSRVTLWGQLRVAEAGAVRLQVLRGGWTTLGGAVRTSRAGYFSWTGALPRGARVRAVAGGIAGAAISIR
jgi:hypothetical protein